jgi:hypothetical protein
MFSQTLLMFINKYSVRPQREYLIICLETENPCWKHNSLEGLRKIMCREYNHSIMLYFSNASNR